jgi:hypothetical protein
VDLHFPFPICLYGVDRDKFSFYSSNNDNNIIATWDSSGRIVTRLEDPGLEYLQEQEIFLFSKTVQTGSGAHPACYSVGIEGSLSGVKAVGV